MPLGASSLLQLMWLASPALPVGGFSYSEALEAAVEAGMVRDAEEASLWLRDQLQLVLVRSEMAVVAKAFKAWRRGDHAELAALNRWVIETRESAEMQQQAQQMGRSLAAWLGQRHADSAALAVLAALTPCPSWPATFALAAERTGAPLRESLLAFAFGWAENMVQAAVKAIPLGQSAGQRILADLASAIPEAADAALHLGHAERQAYAPMLAILSSRHEAQYSRLFRS